MGSIRKRTWIPRGGSVQKTAWVVDYTDRSGQRRNKQFSTKSAATKWHTESSWQLSQGLHTPESASISVSQAVDLWILRAEREKLERTTIEDYSSMAKLHIVPYIGHLNLSQVTSSDVVKFRNELTKKISRPMVAKVLTALSSVFVEAMELGFVAQNITKNVRVRRSSRENSKAIIPTISEIRAIIDSASTPDAAPIDRPMCLTSIFTGIRSSELRGLPWKNVDLAKCTIKIDQRADKFGKIGSPKSAAGHRTIPIPKMLALELKKWKLQCPNSPLDLVFPTGKGTVECHSNILNRHFWPLQMRAGITTTKVSKVGTVILDKGGTPVLRGRYSMHALRHFAASTWIAEKIEPKRIQKWLGHSSIKMTFDVYGHLFDQHEADADIMNAVQNKVIG